MEAGEQQKRGVSVACAVRKGVILLADTQGRADRPVGHAPEAEDGTESGCLELCGEPGIGAGANLRSIGAVGWRQALDRIGDPHPPQAAFAIDQPRCSQAIPEPKRGGVAHEGNTRPICPSLTGGQPHDEQGSALGSSGGYWGVVPVWVSFLKLVEVRGESPAGSTRQKILHCSVPPQLEPAPAVQPRQWGPVAMEARAIRSKLSISQMVLPSEPVSMSSI
jgi:hypothetical protein